jgi:hypothetical protein
MSPLHCYPPKIIGIIVTMIVTGAARSVGVKIFYQNGFVNPLFVTLLYLFGHALALLVYGGSVYLEQRRQQPPHGGGSHNEYHSRHTWNSMISKSIHRTSLHDHAIGALLLAPGIVPAAVTLSDHDDDDDATIVGRPIVMTFWGMLPMGEFSKGRFASTPNGNHIEMMMDPPQHQQPPHGTTTNGDGSTCFNDSHDTNNDTQATQWGSVAGLNEQSKQAVQWVHQIPWYGKPIIPGLCNLGKSALRWASLVYIDASVAEILISGLELVLSVVAARIIRRRLVAHVRWLGVAVVLVGIVWVGLIDTILAGRPGAAAGQPTGDDPAAETSSSSSSPLNGSDSSNSSRRTLTGLMLILAQSIMSAIQDIAEEIFMAESDFPATLLLGMEGLLGFMIGAVLYVPIAPLFGEDAVMAWQQFTATPSTWGYGLSLILLFLVNGIANILTTSATSSMTRNVWKNIRTVLVWVLGLLIFYVANGRRTIGEPWETPKSFLTLLGFFIMLVGIHTYYRPVVPNNRHSVHLGRDDDEGDKRQLQKYDNEGTPPPPQLSDIRTMGSMTTAAHDNTIRQRSSRPRSMTIPQPQRDDDNSSHKDNSIQLQQRPSSSLPNSPRFEIHTRGANSSTKCGSLR